MHQTTNLCAYFEFAIIEVVDVGVIVGEGEKAAGSLQFETSLELLQKGNTTNHDFLLVLIFTIIIS